MLGSASEDQLGSTDRNHEERQSRYAIFGQTWTRDLPTTKQKSQPFGRDD